MPEDVNCEDTTKLLTPCGVGAEEASNLGLLALNKLIKYQSVSGTYKP